MLNFTDYYVLSGGFYTCFSCFLMWSNKFIQSKSIWALCQIILALSMSVFDRTFFRIIIDLKMILLNNT